MYNTKSEDDATQMMQLTGSAAQQSERSAITSLTL